MRSVFPEMTAAILPIQFRLDHEPGDRAVRVAVRDLTGDFERLEADLDTLTAFDLGLFQDCEQRAA